MSDFDFEDDDDSGDRISEDDIFIRRDEDDELLPVEQEIPALGGTAKVVPMPYGKVQKYLGDVGPNEMLDAGALVDILTSHVVDPDLSGMTRDDLEERMKPMAPQAFLLAVFQASGVDGNLVDDGEGGAEVELDPGNRS